MNRLNTLGRAASWLAAVAMVAAPGMASAVESTPLLPAPTSASPAVKPLSVVDVALDASGALNGQAMSSQGQPLAHAPVTLDDGTRQWQATTNADGAFRFDGVHGGSYRIQSGNQMQLCRAWKAGTAPPSANRAVMVVDGQPTVLGQYCGSPVGCGTPVCDGLSGCKELLRNPLVIGGIIAAAIAIPVAIHNADDDDPAS